MEHTLTARSAFDAMIDFLTMYWYATRCEQLAGLLSDMNTNIWADGSTADPAIWEEWLEAIQTVPRAQLNGLTPMQAFQAMHYFLTNYIPFNDTSSQIVDALKTGTQIREDGSVENPLLWDRWLQFAGRTEASNSS